MSFPSVEKTWQFVVNEPNSHTTAANQAKTFLYHVKRLLQEFSDSPWGVWGSCTGLGGGGSFGNGDGVDRWASFSEINFGAAGVNHSWLVLTQPGIGPKTSLLIDYLTLNTASFRLSPALGFGAANGGTDGDAQNAPTAVDQINLTALDGLPFPLWGGSGTPFSHLSTTHIPYRLHVMQSTDGQCTRVFRTRSDAANRVCILWLSIETIKEPTADWVTPVLGCAMGSGDVTAHPTRSQLTNSTTWSRLCAGSFDTSGDPRTCLALTPADSYLADTYSKSVGLYPAKLVANNDAPVQGHKGWLYDMWLSSAPFDLLGTHWPEDGSKELMQFHGIVVPWNGTILRV